MNIPTSQPIPEENEPISPARRRRERRLPIPTAGASHDERAAFLDQLAERAIPSFDYYLFSFAAGLVMGAGILLGSPALLILGAVLAPLSSPYLGLGLACIAGSWRFFLTSLATAGIGGFLALGGGYLVGYASRFFPGLAQPLVQADAATQFSWPALLALSLGVALTAIAFARSWQKVHLTGAVISFLLLAPLVSAGFGLASGIPGYWPSGLVVYAVYLAWTVILSALIYGFLGLRPLSGFGYFLGACIAVASLAVLIGLGGMEMSARGQTSIPLAQPSRVPAQAALAGPSHTPPAPATVTPIPSATHTIVPSPTPTVTLTPAPTPVWAIVNAASFNGAFIRAEPKFGSKILISVLNGTLVQVLPDTVKDSGTLWVHVKTSEGLDGWIVEELLVTATPVPGW
jgi:hypothetical protein